jgi:hypothetical protein
MGKFKYEPTVRPFPMSGTSEETTLIEAEEDEFCLATLLQIVEEKGLDPQKVRVGSTTRYCHGEWEPRVYATCVEYTPNPNYDAEMREYQKARERHDRWKAEHDAEKRLAEAEADLQVAKLVLARVREETRPKREKKG